MIRQPQSNTPLIALGIDPGSRITGFGVVALQGRTLRYLGSGAIRTGLDDFPARLGEIYRGVEEVIATYHPQVCAIESVFVARNVQSALKLGQARGAAIAAVVAAALPVSEYAPRHVKRAVVGTGRATKEQVQHMVRTLLGLPQTPAADAADALAIAITHVNTASTSEL